mmetsp:Transcript_2910/g.5010  ORF Transcript_2910/g.5010 Transcript_2910/m.5010 type:complete len:82 (+) Transcript_2910:232-477(+)
MQPSTTLTSTPPSDRALRQSLEGLQLAPSQPDAVGLMEPCHRPGPQRLYDQTMQEVREKQVFIGLSRMADKNMSSRSVLLG